jgi:hypothetical protein
MYLSNDADSTTNQNILFYYTKLALSPLENKKVKWLGYKVLLTLLVLKAESNMVMNIT